MTEVELNVNVLVSERLNADLLNAVKEATEKCVEFLALRYEFDAVEAKELLVFKLKLGGGKVGKSKSGVEKKSAVLKPAFPLPYNGELNFHGCFALRHNSGLFTQCSGVRGSTGEFCKGCASRMQKMGAESPEYGTITQRRAVGMFEYVDPKGRKPIAYTKIMKKHNLSEEQVKEEAGKFNMTVHESHFIAPEETKRGRPKTEKVPKEKGAKGRPKKTQISLEIAGDDTEEEAKVNFKELVRETIEESDVSEQTAVVKKGKTDEEKEAEKKEKEAKRLAEKEAAEKAKAEKKEAAEKAKAEKKEAAEKAKAEKKEAAEKAKAEKKEAVEKAKAEKKEAAEKAKAEKAKAEKKKATEGETEAEPETPPDVVTSIKFEGKKYLKSKTTGIVYDYDKYVKEGEQVVVGKWSDATEKIIFDDADDDDEEEEEENYDM
jgi:hypothetical protein